MSRMSVGEHQEGARWNENELTDGHKSWRKKLCNNMNKKWEQGQLTDGDKTELMDGHSIWNNSWIQMKLIGFHRIRKRSGCKN